MNDTIQSFENICDMSTLQTHLSAIALFIGMYEKMIDMIEERVEAFLCDDYIAAQNNHLKCVHNDLYRKYIKNRPVDEKGNKNSLKATMLWYVDVGAITQKDYDTFLHLKKLRDSYVHQMTDHIWNGLTEDNSRDLIALLELFIKLDQWWINEVEIPLSAEDVPEDYDREAVSSMALSTFLMMIQILYAGKSEEYLKIIDEFKRDLGVKPK